MKPRKIFKPAGPLNIQVLLNYAFRLLSRRDYGEEEMRKKLERRAKLFGVPESESGVPVWDNIIQAALARLKDLSYLHDEKFTKHFLESRTRLSPRGKYLLAWEMKQKGIPPEIFEKVWQEGGYSDEALADEFLQQKKRIFQGLSLEKRKKKIVSLLSSRGFPGDIIFRLAEGKNTLLY